MRDLLTSSARSNTLAPSPRRSSPNRASGSFPLPGNPTFVLLVTSSQTARFALHSPYPRKVPAGEELRYARLYSVHGAVRSRAFVRMEQAAPRNRHSHDLRRGHPADSHQVDSWSSRVRAWLGIFVSGPSHRRQSSGLLSRANLLTGWATLGRKRSMDVPYGSKPYAGLRRDKNNSLVSCRLF